MPTYVFKCQKCGCCIEHLMSIREYSSTPSPMCVEDGCDGQQEMKVQLQPVGTIFKGSGWTPRSEHSFGAPTELAMPKKR